MTADAFVIHQDDVISVAIDDSPIDVSLEESSPVAVVLVEGPRGPSGKQSYSEILNGSLQDGRVTFSLSQASINPEYMTVSRNGLTEIHGIGFTATATEVTFTTPPLSSDVILISYDI